MDNADSDFLPGQEVAVISKCCKGNKCIGEKKTMNVLATIKTFQEKCTL